MTYVRQTKFIFMIMQKYFVEGVASTELKG